MNVTTNLELCSYINENYSKEDLTAFECFTSQLFLRLHSDEMEMLSIVQRYQMALSLWQSFSCRSVHENKVVIETRTQQGVLADVSVLHIITDDKAFVSRLRVLRIEVMTLDKEDKARIFMEKLHKQIG